MSCINVSHCPSTCSFHYLATFKPLLLPTVTVLPRTPLNASAMARAVDGATSSPRSALRTVFCDNLARRANSAWLSPDSLYNSSIVGTDCHLQFCLIVQV